MDNSEKTISYYINRCRPYSLDRFESDVRQACIERVEFLKKPRADPTEGRAEFAASFSVFARRRRIGVLMMILYTIATRENLDMTQVFAYRLLEKMVGRSVRANILGEAFASPGRTAAERTEDWERIDSLVEKYRESTLNALERDKKRQAEIKRKIRMEYGL